MTRTIKLQSHLTLPELEQRYRQAADVVAKTQWQVVWLFAQGRSTEDIAQITGYTAWWVRRLLSRYNKQGEQGIGDKRHQNPGAQPLLSDELQAELWQVLENPPPDGGLWTSRKVAQWMSERLDRPIHLPRGWEQLRGMDFTLRRPRPAHQQADSQAQEDFKKYVEEIQEQYPEAKVEV